MKIFKKEISKKTVKVFIGGVVAMVIGGTIIGVVAHNNKQPELESDVELLEVPSYDEESVEEC